ncbi:MAG: DNA glycosylase [Acidimicrobiia bacterium]
MARRSLLGDWYTRHGRHTLPWRHTRDRWSVLTAEVMLHQTQVPRVLAAWPAFTAELPAPAAVVSAGPAAVIRAWGRLGYPRRARRLHDAAVVIVRDGWPADLRVLPGVGRYTAAAVRAQADGWDVPAVDVNIRRVGQRVPGRLLRDAEAERAMVDTGHPLRGRDRLLALMDLGALVCRPREPRCGECPLRPRCATRGPLDGEARRPAAPYAGSFRQRRGRVLAVLRAGPAPADALDADALASLVADDLARVEDGLARLP